MRASTIILGGGVTGLAAGYASRFPVFEAADTPGGICSSYYIRPRSTERLHEAPADGEAYRFEIGGGHWIFGGDPAVLRLIRRLTPVRSYCRRSAVYFSEEARYVPYPLQYHLAHLEAEVATRALREMMTPSEIVPVTMAEWLTARFGPTLTERFFGPFHAHYTAGLWTQIAPQDPYKSPVDPALARQGARGETPSTGYNARFIYPEGGLDTLARALAQQSTVHYGKRVVRVDPHNKVVYFADDSVCAYETLISTLPLNKMIAMAGLATEDEPDAHTSVLVLNIGALRGGACPDHHWLYVPDSAAGFFRVGCYSNVDSSFLPRSSQQDRVSLYVERAFPGGERPAEVDLLTYVDAVIVELQAHGFIGDVEVVDPTWIEVAYTWSRPDSAWRTQALHVLEAHDIMMVGRYARWTFQGIADSIRDGLVVGTALRDG